MSEAELEVEELEEPEEEVVVEVPQEEEEIEVIAETPAATQKKAQRKSQKQRQREGRERTFRELDSLREENTQLHARLDSLEQNQHAQHVETQEDSISRTLHAHKQNSSLADQAFVKAVENGDHEAAAKAMSAGRDVEREMMKLEARQEDLKERQAADRAAAAERQQQKDNNLPSFVGNQMGAFLEDHSWFDPKGGDDNSQAITRLDRKLQNEGYDPRENSYWNELRKGAEEIEGDNASNVDVKPTRTRGPNMPAKGRTHSLKKGQIALSKERLSALEQMGLEKGTDEWKDMVKYYYEYDQRNPRQ